MTHHQMPKTTFGLVDVCKGWREQKNTHNNSRKRDCCNCTHCIFYFPMLQIFFQGTYLQRFGKKLIKNIRENIGKHKLRLKKLRKTWKYQQPKKLGENWKYLEKAEIFTILLYYTLRVFKEYKLKTSPACTSIKMFQ